jgi:cyanophycinase
MKTSLRAIFAYVGIVFLVSMDPLQVAGQPVKGHLVIIGGGERTGEIMSRFIALAGGPEKARIIILPMASSVPDTTGMEQAVEFRSRGVQNVEWFIVTREQASAQQVIDRFNGATGIFFSGGDQVRITRALVGTPVQRKLIELYREGSVIGGTSAGAAIMSKIMITGEELIHKDTTNIFVSIMKGNVETIEGMGFLEDVIIDQHFIKRKRLNRLISVVLEHPALPGVGIDESTALQVDPGGSLEVLGEGTVVVIDARKASGVRADARGDLVARDIRMSIYTAGEKFTVQPAVAKRGPIR